AFPRGARGRRLRLDEGGEIRLEPDLSWWEGATCTFVGDAKYKRTTGAGVENADLYQLLGYVTGANVPGGLLVYAGGEGSPATYQVVHAGKQLEVTTLDLRGSPAEILAQTRRLARQVSFWRDKALGHPVRARGASDQLG